MKKKKKGGKMCHIEFTPQNGCGKKNCSSIDLYIMPYSSTKEGFNEYVEQGVKRLEEDNRLK